jgi:hypothetical protein
MSERAGFKEGDRRLFRGEKILAGFIPLIPGDPW